MLKKRIALTFMFLLVISISLAAGFKYSPNVKPHTRYNPLRYGCYYYYGYGSCEVSNEHCRGVPVGRNKWIDLGDACNRNEPPILTNLKDITATETEIVKITARCTDQDPVNMTYSGWTSKAETLTTYDDAGRHTATVTCTDSFGETDTANITIIIKDKNRPPLFRSLGYEIE